MLTKCCRCGSVYGSGPYYYGYYSETGTNPDHFVPTGGKLPDGYCPYCQKPPQLERTPDPEPL